jgi:hypothetical protein
MIIVKFLQLVFLTLLEYNNPISRLLFAIILLLLWYALIYYKHTYNKPITIDDYFIVSKSIIIFIISTFFIGYVGGILYLRIINAQKTVNIYKAISWLIRYIIKTDWFSLFTSICLILSLILLILFIINWYRKVILKYYLQLHFLIISYYPEYNNPPLSAFFYWNFDDEQPYESLKYLIERQIIRCRSIVTKCIKFLPDTEVQQKLVIWFSTNYKLYGVILMIFLIVYDTLLNKGNITKVFYIMPFVFLYYLLCKYEETLFLYTFDEEECIVTYIYFEIITPEEPGFVAFSNDKMISFEQLNNIIANVIPSKHK